MGREIPQVNSENDPKKKEITEYDWNEMLKKGKIKKEDMDMLVMDFLVNNELPHVADAFRKESGCQYVYPHELQTDVYDLLFERQYDEAINLLNEKLGLSFLKERRQLHFRLEKQNMIELRYKRNFKDAWYFTPKFLMWADDINFREDSFNTIFELFTGIPVSSQRLEFLRSYSYANCVVEEMKIFHGRIQGNLLNGVVKGLRMVQDELNLEVTFPNFNFDSGYPEAHPC